MKDDGKDDSDRSDVQGDDIWSYNTDTGGYKHTLKDILKNHHRSQNYAIFTARTTKLPEGSVFACICHSVNGGEGHLGPYSPDPTPSSQTIPPGPYPPGP